MVTRIAWLVLAAIHLLPALALVRPAMLEQLYGIDRDSALFPIVWHRAALFMIVMLIAVWAAIRPDVRPVAIFAVGTSMISFLLIYIASGSPAMLRTIAIADLVGLPFLFWVIVAQYRGTGA